MPRARTIKPGFFKNEELAQLPPLTRILFSGLWILADREGRLEDRPRRIKAEVLPYDECDIDRMLRELHDSGFIVRYESGASRYISIPTWNKHQNPHKNEQQSTIPGPYLTDSGISQEPEQHDACTEKIGTNTESLGSAPACIPISRSSNYLSSDHQNRENGEPASRGPTECLDLWEWFQQTFIGGIEQDCWREFGKQLCTPERAEAFQFNHPLWMKTKKYKSGFVGARAYLQSGIWLNPPAESLIEEGRSAAQQNPHEVFYPSMPNYDKWEAEADREGGNVQQQPD